MGRGDEGLGYSSPWQGGQDGKNTSCLPLASYPGPSHAKEPGYKASLPPATRSWAITGSEGVCAAAYVGQNKHHQCPYSWHHSGWAYLYWLAPHSSPKFCSSSTPYTKDVALWSIAAVTRAQRAAVAGRLASLVREGNKEHFTRSTCSLSINEVGLHMASQPLSWWSVESAQPEPRGLVVETNTKCV